MPPMRNAPMPGDRGAPGGETQLFVKEVIADGVRYIVLRYIVCRNEAEAEKDRADRLTIVDGLQRRLKQGEKALIGERSDAAEGADEAAGPPPTRPFRGIGEADAGWDNGSTS